MGTQDLKVTSCVDITKQHYQDMAKSLSELECCCLWPSSGIFRGTRLECYNVTTVPSNVYIIGNNPTDVEKEYFQKLTDALKGGTPEEIAEAVAEAARRSGVARL